MMRWNSTRTYTEEDILRMQQEAVNRVHEFQSRAKTLPFYDVPESAITPYQEPEPEETPYNAPEPFFQSQPKAIPEPAETAEAEPEPQQPAQQPEAQYATPAPINTAPPTGPGMMGQQTPPPPTDPITGILSKLNLDGETLLILGLMFLLYNEKADNVLLIALAYLLL